MTKLRRAYKTTEFWLVVAFMAGGFISLVLGIILKADLLGIAAVLGAISTPTITQVWKRNDVKVRHGDLDTQ